jgi:4-amino-4-deoxy-L-arabinose transferase
MFKTYFDTTQLSFLIPGFIFFLISLLFHIKDKEKLSIFFLLVSALSIFIFAGLLDPFVNMWDERFHALVAKNLLKHPLMPTLYDDPVLKISDDMKRWDLYHIWLHKQPLFLWQIALSFKIFGVNELALRIPSIIFGVILIYIGYRSGKILVNTRVGYITGVLILSTFYFIQLISGQLATDHNDCSFLVYVSLSIWSLIEYNYSKNIKWIYCIGLFSGLAILCKWLVGLLVYFGWSLLIIQEDRFNVKKYKPLFTALIITLIIAVPWQIFTFINYPIEARYAFAENGKHFFEVVDGHTGSFWFHFEQFNVIYGAFASFLIIPSFVIFRNKILDKKMYFSLFSMIVVVYLFFSIAVTKMPGFTIIVALPVFISFACLLDYIFNYLNTRIKSSPLRNGVIFLSVSTIAFVRFDLDSLQEKHTLWKAENFWTPTFSYNRTVFKKLNLPPNAVLFNVKKEQAIAAMFYTGVTCYDFIPSHEQYDIVKSKGRVVAIFVPSAGSLPAYVNIDPTVIKISETLRGWD